MLFVAFCRVEIKMVLKHCNTFPFQFLKTIFCFTFQICFGCAFLDRFSGSNSNISQTQHETIGNLGHAEAATLLARRGNKQEEIEVELVDASCPVHMTHSVPVVVGKDTQNTTSL